MSLLVLGNAMVQEIQSGFEARCQKKLWYDKETCVNPLYETFPVIKQAEQSRVHEPKKTKKNGHLQSPSIPSLK